MNKKITLKRKGPPANNTLQTPEGRFLFVFDFMELARSFNKDRQLPQDRSINSIVLSKK